MCAGGDLKAAMSLFCTDFVSECVCVCVCVVISGQCHPCFALSDDEGVCVCVCGDLRAVPSLFCTV